MYAAPFDYFRATSIDDAQRLLKAHPEAKIVAGGHSLIPLMKMRLATPPAVIDIARIKDLKQVALKGSAIHVGALVTHAEVAASTALQSACPMLAEAAAGVGDAQVRNLGTVGGNIAHADPASDLPTVLLALDAIVHVVGPRGSRTIAIGDFFQGMMATALEPDEILTGIAIPAIQKGRGMAYVKFPHPASRYAVIGVAAVVDVASGTCRAARVAIGGLLPAPARCPAVERALVDQRVTLDATRRAAREVAQTLGDATMGDVFASSAYRAAVAPVYVARALTAAFGRAA